MRLPSCHLDDFFEVFNVLLKLYPGFGAKKFFPAQLFAQKKNHFLRAVSQLRERKRRYGKPFAVMVGTVEEAGQLIEIDEAARQLLLSRERPVVVARSHTRALAPSLSTGLDTLGYLLEIVRLEAESSARNSPRPNGRRS